ncbi:NAD(P)/FAD-dependent oxidoreductase [Hydrogenimonas sp.]
MKHIVVAGAGYGGLRAVEKLAKISDIEITLLDENQYHYMQTEVYGYIAGTKDIDEIAIDLESWCNGFEREVKFMKAKVTNIDHHQRYVYTDHGRIDYDILVVATGARTHFPSSIEGLRGHSFGIKKLERAFDFRLRFERHIEQKLEGDDSEINILVAGAGLSGVEVAAEMAYMLKRYRPSLGKKADRIKITLIDACDTILPGLDPFLIESAKKRLERLDVTIQTGAFIEKVEDNRVIFQDGSFCAYTFMVFTGGIVANSEFVPKNFERNRLGQLKVESDLHLKGAENIYALGDVAEITDTNGNPLPPTAQVAERSAEHIVENILLQLGGSATRPFHGKIDGLFIALGGRYGAAELFFFHFKGLSAYYAKRLITYIYTLGLNLRVNAVYKIRQ